MVIPRLSNRGGILATSSLGFSRSTRVVPQHSPALVVKVEVFMTVAGRQDKGRAELGPGGGTCYVKTMGKAMGKPWGNYMG